MHQKLTDEEINRLLQLEAHVKLMFEVAETEGLFIGMGRAAHLCNADQEGPLTKQLRKLVYKLED